MKTESEISKIEEEIFYSIKRKFPGKPFWEDGIVEYNSYSKSSPRILYVLKDPNAPGESGNLREFLRNGGYGLTWNPVAFWTYGVYNDFPNWETVMNLDLKMLRLEWLKKIAAINLKKVPGRGNATDKVIKEYALKCIDELKEQIELYCPDMIIVCGKDYVSFIPELFNSLPYPIMEVNHPQYPGKTNKWKYEAFQYKYKENK